MALQSSIVTKSIAVLDALGDGNRPQTFSEIVKATAFNKSTVHRLLSILTTEGLARYDENTKTYMLGNKLLELARKAWRGYDIQALALDEMLRLHDLVQENVSIGVMQGDEVVHLRMIESQFHWGVVHPPVMREPQHSTATGKALLAFLPPQILSACLDKQKFPRSTARTITSRAAFEKELKKVRETGFARTDREQMDYVVGIAAPIFNFLDEPIAALNIWAPTNRCSLSDLLQWSDALKTSADRVSALIGGNRGQDREINPSAPAPSRSEKKAS